MAAAEKLFQSMVEGIREYAIYMIDSAGHVMTWNAGAERLKGWRSEEIVGQHFATFFLPEDVASGRPQRLLMTAAAQGQVSEEWWRRRKDGSRFWASILLTALFDSQGDLIGYSKVTRDLTERRTQEAALEATLMFQTAILQGAHLAIIATDEKGIIRSFNPAAERMLGYRAQEMVGIKTPEVILDSEEVRQRAMELSGELHQRIDPGFEVFVAKARGGMAEEHEWTCVRKDGSRFPVLLSVSALRASDCSIAGFLCIASDNTLRRRDEEQIREALREKEVLLKEVYHRVKNNLQVVQSLLSLQRRTLPEGVARSVIDDATQRVRAMALVHEKLYQSANLSALSLPAYVRDLCKQLAAALNPRSSNIELHTDIVAGEVGLDTAVPLGLLLTELVSNSLKHAFPGQRGGRVEITLKREGEWTVLTVADNGIGLPPEFNLQATQSLGLKLAVNLARQLGGELQASSSGGARFSVRLPKI
jgi:PAS domain S-box-containing protein